MSQDDRVKGIEFLEPRGESGFADGEVDWDLSQGTASLTETGWQWAEGLSCWSAAGRRSPEFGAFLMVKWHGEWVASGLV